MQVAVAVADVAVELVEAAFGWIGRPVRWSEVVVLAVIGPLQAILADQPGALAGSLHHRRQRVIVCQRLVELVVADLCVPLVDAAEQR